MRENHTLAKMRRGEAAVGLWLHSHSLQIARLIAARERFDWLLVDMEHTPLDVATGGAVVAAIGDISAGTCTPLLRVPDGTIFHIKQALDAGAHGIIVPMVNTAEDAANVVRWSRYPPEGERGAGGIVPHLSFGTTEQKEYIRDANAQMLVCVQIETAQAVENIEAILEVPGIDLVFIGPFDLHLSLGLTPGMWSEAPLFVDAVQKVIGACKARGIPYGTLTSDAEGAKARLADGFRFIGLGTDLNHLLNALDAQVKQLNDAE